MADKERAAARCGQLSQTCQGTSNLRSYPPHLLPTLIQRGDLFCFQISSMQRHSSAHLACVGSKKQLGRTFPIETIRDGRGSLDGSRIFRVPAVRDGGCRPWGGCSYQCKRLCRGQCLRTLREAPPTFESKKKVRSRHQLFNKKSTGEWLANGSRVSTSTLPCNGTSTSPSTRPLNPHTI